MCIQNSKRYRWRRRTVGYKLILVLTAFCWGPVTGQQAPDSLKALLKQHMPASSRAAIFYRISEAFSKNNYPDSAIAYARLSEKIYSESADWVNAARCNHLLGHQYLKQQSFTESKKYYTRALELSQKSGDKESILESQESMAWFYHDIGSFRLSDEAFSRALLLAQSLQLEEKVVTIRAASGSNLLSQGQYAAAQKEYFYAADYFKKKKDIQNYAFYLSTGANLYRRLGQAGKAEEPLKEAYRLQKEMNDLPGMITASRFLGMLYTEQGKFDEAENYLSESLDLAQKSKNHLLIIKSYYTLERLYYGRGDFENGDKYQKAVIRLRDSLYSAENNKALAEFDVKYSTAQREKELAESRLEVTRKQNWIIGLTLTLLSLLAFGIAHLSIRGIKQRASLQEAEIEKQGAILKARDLERKRIAQELHDSVGSQLTVVSSGLDNALFLAMHQQLMPEKLEALNEDVRTAAQSLRDTIWATYNFSIPAANVYSRMQSYLNRVREQGGLSIRAGLHGEDLLLNSIQALHIFRIFQEAVQNTLKHAYASEIALLVSLDSGTFRMEVSDNGKGFFPAAVPANERFGLQNMQARCEEINAEIRIESAQNKGTKITVDLGNLTSPS